MRSRSRLRLRTSTSGAWKGTYDNNLDMEIHKTLEQYKSPANDKIERSKMDDTAIMDNVSFDPLGRPHNLSDEVSRLSDYTPK